MWQQIRLLLSLASCQSVASMCVCVATFYFSVDIIWKLPYVARLAAWQGIAKVKGSFSGVGTPCVKSTRCSQRYGARLTIGTITMGELKLPIGEAPPHFFNIYMHRSRSISLLNAPEAAQPQLTTKIPPIPLRWWMRSRSTVTTLDNGKPGPYKFQFAFIWDISACDCYRSASFAFC